ncbi:MAG: App1 family protein [Proteobacteria bacterium]|jgi:hypothetical protein|nr:App1 family protein [Pseudomonadota bacterium]
MTKSWTSLVHLLLGVLLLIGGSVSVAEGSRTSRSTILISDIDDTLKISHVLNTAESVGSAGKVGNHFLGMAGLFRHADIPTYYVSNAPESLMGASHELFLMYNDFPAGEMHLRKSLSDENHKVETLIEIIDRTKPERVILVGDNGEQDPAIYQLIQSRYPEIQFQIYIHWVYDSQGKSDRGAPLPAGQRGFVTALDLGLQWVQTGDLSANDLQSFELTLLNQRPELKKLLLKRCR